jgi:hypothetical protein
MPRTLRRDCRWSCTKTAAIGDAGHGERFDVWFDIQDAGARFTLIPAPCCPDEEAAKAKIPFYVLIAESGNWYTSRACSTVTCIVSWVASICRYGMG